MKQLQSPLPIFGLQVGELKATMVGGAPRVWARIVCLNAEGMTVSDTAFTALSEKSWELLKELNKSIETDFENTLRHKDFAQWSTEEASGIDFTSRNAEEDDGDAWKV